MVNRFIAATERARSFLAADEGRLWGAPLDEVDWMGIESGRLHLTADPGMIGYQRAATGLWSGPLPDGLPVASTSLQWAGRWWSAYELPLPDDSDRYDAARDLVHEAIHVKQMERARVAGWYVGPADRRASASHVVVAPTAVGPRA